MGGLSYMQPTPVGLATCRDGQLGALVSSSASLCFVTWGGDDQPIAPCVLTRLHPRAGPFCFPSHAIWFFYSRHDPLACLKASCLQVHQKKNLKMKMKRR